MRYFHLMGKIGKTPGKLPKGARELQPRMGAVLFDAQQKDADAPIDFEGISRWEVDPDAQERLIVEANRRKRNELLAESDHLFVADRNLPEERLAPWRAYRQQLRDLDLTEEVDWPTPPEK